MPQAAKIVSAIRAISQVVIGWRRSQTHSAVERASDGADPWSAIFFSNNAQRLGTLPAAETLLNLKAAEWLAIKTPSTR